MRHFGHDFADSVALGVELLERGEAVERRQLFERVCGQIEHAQSAQSLQTCQRTDLVVVQVEDVEALQGLQALR